MEYYKLPCLSNKRERNMRETACLIKEKEKFPWNLLLICLTGQKVEYTWILDPFLWVISEQKSRLGTN